ncbi:MAG: hypothetical protein LBS19_02845 [Clostridiales bacterium]|jgi:hypothetical protein|nr:hypothetical protein [Clostridiales bacterium]
MNPKTFCNPKRALAAVMSVALILTTPVYKVNAAQTPPIFIEMSDIEVTYDVKPVCREGLKFSGPQSDLSAQNYFFDNADSFLKAIQAHLTGQGLNVESLVVGNQIPIVNSDAFLIPVMNKSGDIIIMAVLFGKDNDGHFEINIGEYYANALNQLDKSFVYTIIQVTTGGVVAVSSNGTITVLAPPAGISEQDFLTGFKINDYPLDFENYVDINQDARSYSIPPLNVISYRR